MKISDFIAGAKHQEAESSLSRASPETVPDPGSAGPVPVPGPDAECREGTSRSPGAAGRRTAAGIVCLAIVAAIGFGLWREGTPSTDQASVERDAYPVSSQTTGTIAKIFVSNGQYVRAGDLLVEMDKREVETELAAAAAEVIRDQATLQASAARLAKAQPALEKAVLAVRHRERELDTALLDYQAVLGVQAKKGIPPAWLSAARKGYEEALSLYSQAKATLAAAIERVQSDQELRATLAVKLQSAQATIQRAEQQLSDARIYAKVNGRVLFDKSKLAQHLRAGEVFLRLMGDPCVVAHFNRSQLKHLKPGDRVKIRVGAIRDHMFRGSVASLAAPAHRDTAGRAPARQPAAPASPSSPTVPVRIAFDTDSLLGFEDRLDPGAASSVEVGAD
ncbi:MAG: HlyD family secretion protein [Verrucomicrobia bacterium]|nr:HlyD family secretion protein [Verrucomicrobiota bacterium]